MPETPHIPEVFLFGKEFGPGFRDHFRILMRRLAGYRPAISLHKPFFDFLSGWYDGPLEAFRIFSSHEELKGHSGILFSIGGDGTFLEAVTLVRDLPLSIVGINSGRLGYLAAISQEEIPDAIDNIMLGRSTLEERVLLQLRGGSPFGDFNCALNEITVHKRDDSTMIKINAYLDGHFLNGYWADGLIVATPTGSTAYSLSVGGPLVLPDTPAFILSPIAPHNLTARPLVYSDTLGLTLQIESRSGKFLVTADSRSMVVEDHIELHIGKAPFRIQTHRLRDQNIYHTLRTKLMWGVDRRN